MKRSHQCHYLQQLLLPELASGKVCVDYSAVNAAKENNFLSVDELLRARKTKKGVITPATGIVVEETIS